MNLDLLVLDENGKHKRKPSAQQTIDFSSIRLGDGSVQLSQATGELAIDIGAAVIRTTGAPVGNSDLVNKGALDSAISSQLGVFQSGTEWKSHVKYATSMQIIASLEPSPTTTAQIESHVETEGTYTLVEGDYVLSFFDNNIYRVNAGLTLDIITGGSTGLHGDKEEAPAVGHARLALIDLPDTPGERENGAVYTFNGAEFVKTADVDWNLASGINLDTSYAMTSGSVSVGDSIQDAIAKLDQARADLVAAVADHESRLVTAESAITDHGTRLTTAEGEIDTLQIDVDTAEAAIIALQNADIALDTRLTSAETSITTLASDASALEGRVTTAEGEIDTLQGDVITLQASMATAEGEIDTLQSDATALTGRVTTAEGEIDTLQSDLTALTTRVTTAEGEIDTLQSDLDALEATVGAMVTEVIATDDSIIVANGNEIKVNIDDVTIELGAGGGASTPADEDFAQFAIDSGYQAYASSLDPVTNMVYFLAYNSLASIGDRTRLYFKENVSGVSSFSFQNVLGATLGEFGVKNGVVLYRNNNNIVKSTENGANSTLVVNLAGIANFNGAGVHTYHDGKIYIVFSKFDGMTETRHLGIAGDDGSFVEKQIDAFANMLESAIAVDKSSLYPNNIVLYGDYQGMSQALNISYDGGDSWTYYTDPSIPQMAHSIATHAGVVYFFINGDQNLYYISNFAPITVESVSCSVGVNVIVSNLHVNDTGIYLSASKTGPSAILAYTPDVTTPFTYTNNGQDGLLTSSFRLLKVTDNGSMLAGAYNTTDGVFVKNGATSGSGGGSGLQVKAGSLADEHISASAAIAESKLALDHSTSSLNTAIGTVQTNLTNYSSATDLRLLDLEDNSPVSKFTFEANPSSIPNGGVAVIGGTGNKELLVPDLHTGAANSSKTFAIVTDSVNKIAVVSRNYPLTGLALLANNEYFIDPLDNGIKLYANCTFVTGDAVISVGRTFLDSSNTVFLLWSPEYRFEY